MTQSLVIFAIVSACSEPKSETSPKTVETEPSAIRIVGEATLYREQSFPVCSMGPEATIRDRTIHRGDIIDFEKTQLQANYIYATHFLEEMRYGNEILGSAGQTSCLIIEKTSDNPSNERACNKRWVNVPNCEIISETQGTNDLKLISPSQWADFSDSTMDVYTSSVLETYSFWLYGHLPEDGSRNPEFSDFRLCAESVPAQKFRAFVWVWGDIERSAAQEIVRTAPMICKSYMGKGDRQIQPLRLITRREWEKFSAQKISAYVAGYIETSYFLEATAGTSNAGALKKCLSEVGLDAVKKNINSEEIEWQFPMPWTISVALGATCKPFL